MVKDVCGDTVLVNNTVVVNPGWPHSYSAESHCTYHLRRPGHNVCFLRLQMDINFLHAGVQGDTTSTDNGRCSVDNIVTDCGKGTRFPSQFCGDNSNQHGKLILLPHFFTLLYSSISCFAINTISERCRLMENIGCII